MDCPICNGETKHICRKDKDGYVCLNPVCGWTEFDQHAYLHKKIETLSQDELRTLRAIINDKTVEDVIRDGINGFKNNKRIGDYA